MYYTQLLDIMNHLHDMMRHPLNILRHLLDIIILQLGMRHPLDIMRHPFSIVCHLRVHFVDAACVSSLTGATCSMIHRCNERF